MDTEARTAGSASDTAAPDRGIDWTFSGGPVGTVLVGGFAGSLTAGVSTTCVGAPIADGPLAERE